MSQSILLKVIRLMAAELLDAWYDKFGYEVKSVDEVVNEFIKKAVEV